MSLALGRCFEAKRQPRRFLQRKVARRPGIGMAEAEQQIDVGGPGADAVQRRERGMRIVGRHLGQAHRRSIAPLAIAAASAFSVLIFGCREAERAPAWPARARRSAS